MRCALYKGKSRDRASMALVSCPDPTNFVDYSTKCVGSGHETSVALTMPPSHKYCNSLPCWSVINELSRQRLFAVHHSLGSGTIDPAEAAETFSDIVGELLLECEVIIRNSESKGPHCPRPIENTLRKLSKMKNAARKSSNVDHDKFVHLVRAHNRVKRCHLHQQHTNNVSKNEREFRGYTPRRG